MVACSRVCVCSASSAKRPRGSDGVTPRAAMLGLENAESIFALEAEEPAVSTVSDLGLASPRDWPPLSCVCLLVCRAA